MVRALLESGAKLDEASKEGGTALMAASAKGHLGIVRHLLEHGADPNLVQQDGLCALGYASSAGFPQVQFFVC